MLLRIATAARSFLLPHWQCWHDAWGPPAPSTLSQWTCVRSSFLLFQTLNERGIPAVLRSGRSEDGGAFGLLTAMGWESHAWIEAGGRIVDITADQFGHAPVIVVPSDHPAYRHAVDPCHQLPPRRAAVAAVTDIWPSWRAYLDGCM